MASGSIAKKVVGISIGLFMTAILVPTALDLIFAAVTTAWDATVVTIFRVLVTSLALIAVALAFYSEVDL